MYFHGPYCVISVDPSLKTAIIQELDNNLQIVGRPKKVHITYLRPTLALAFKHRAKLNAKAEWET